MTRRLVAACLAMVVAAGLGACALQRVNTRYNRFTDELIVTHRGLDLVPANPWAGTSLKLKIEYTGQGALPPRPETITVAIVAVGKTAAYKQDHHLDLFADGAMLESREVGYDPTRQAGMIVEYMWVKLPTAIFVALADAKAINGRIGPTPYVLTEDQIAELKEFARNLPKEGRRPMLELPFKLP
jgi:hypothetical protein